METIGSYLKRERELRKIPLEDIVHATKIPPHSLAALEADNWKALPGHVFAKGFVQSYAKAIGLNSDDVVLQLEEHLKTLRGPEKMGWLKPRKVQFKSWVLFLAFVAVVVMAAYLSSR